MILSSADILNILGGSEIIRLSAKLSIVDGKPKLTGAEGVYICIERFPKLDEFEATWTIYVEGDEDMELVVAEMKRLLPKVQVKPGLMTEVTTTDFRSESTQRAPEAPKAQTAQVDLTQYEERFQALVEDVQDQMLLVTSGRAGKDGKDGYNGKDGRDGKDIDATETELFDLKDVDQSILSLEKGQVLTWDGTKWTNLFVRTSSTIGGGGAVSDRGLNDIGGIVSPSYKFKDNQTEGYDNGRFRVNSTGGGSDWSGTTELYIAYETEDGKAVKNYILQLIKPGQYCYIQREDDPDAFAMYEVVTSPVDADPKGARIEVSFLAQGSNVGNITDNKACRITFALVSGSGGGGGGATVLDDLTDVSTLGKTAGDALLWSGSQWNAGGDMVGGNF